MIVVGFRCADNHFAAFARRLPGIATLEKASYYLEALVGAAFGTYVQMWHPDISLWSFMLFGQAIMNLGRCHLQPDKDSKNKPAQRVARTVNEFGSWLAIVNIAVMLFLEHGPFGQDGARAESMPQVYRMAVAVNLLVAILATLPTALSTSLSVHTKLRTFRCVAQLPLALVVITEPALMSATSFGQQAQNTAFTFLQFISLYLAFTHRFSKTASSKRTGTSRYIPAWRFGTLASTFLIIIFKMQTTSTAIVKDLGGELEA